MKNSMEITQNTKKKNVPYDPVIPFLDIHSEKTETLIRKDICTPMFV